MTRCGYCNTPADGTYLCKDCTGELRAALNAIATHWTDLQDAIAKNLNHVAAAPTTGAPESSIPINPHASDLKDHITGAVNRLAKRISDRTAHPVPQHTPTIAVWCERRTLAARMIPSIAADRGELAYLAGELVNTIDQPNRRIPVPVPCPECDGPLESHLRRPRVIICKHCKHQFDATRFLPAS